MTASKDLAILHRIDPEIEAGSSNRIILPNEHTAIAKSLIHNLSEEQTLLLEAGFTLQKSHLGKLNAPIVPHKKVPPDILRKIFLETGPEYGPFNSYNPDPKSSPWILRQICSLWRDVVLDIPSFWNTVIFDSINSPDDVSRMEFWALNIRNPLYGFSLDTKQLRPGDVALQKLVVPYQTQTRRLSMNATIELLKMPSGSFPTLETLELIITSYSIVVDNPYHIIQDSPCFIGMDCLRSLSLTFEIHEAGYVCLPTTIPFKQLTSLTLLSERPHIYLTLSVAIQILQECPNLEDCHIQLTVTKEDEEQFTSFTRVDLPHLKSLTLHEDSRQSPYQRSFLPTLLHVPALRFLKLMVDDWSFTGAFNVAGSLVVRSKCALHTLVVDSLTTFGLGPCPEARLEELACLRNLETHALLFTNKAMEKIAEGILLPNIEVLTMAIHDVATIDLMTKLCERRAQLGASLSRGSNSISAARNTNDHGNDHGIDPEIGCSCPPPPIRVIALHLTHDIGVGRDDEELYIKSCLARVKACNSYMAVVAQPQGVITSGEDV
ncbi:hypothetical protein H0H87_003158 [Tephrocybe sp. NHM501043]|nr:hypothetical protein H0H87_003158 [Tephrocybe sp. NHM501043]